MTDIYILKLENNKYYVGKSSDPIKRFQEHIKGKGSSWTREHKPLEIIKTIKNASVFDEDKYVKEYMSKYGINNVRGGSYVSTTLDENQKELLRNELRMAEDKCTRCGRDGHFASSCYAKTQLVEEESESEEEYEYRKPVICYSCNKYGHYASNCYSRNHYTYESDSDEESESDYYSD